MDNKIALVGLGLFCLIIVGQMWIYSDNVTRLSLHYAENCAKIEIVKTQELVIPEINVDEEDVINVYYPNLTEEVEEDEV